MPKSELSDERRRPDGAAAFSSLVERHYQPMWALSYSRIGDWSAAEDVAQEAFLVAFSNYSKLREPRLFPSWLRKIILLLGDAFPLQHLPPGQFPL